MSSDDIDAAISNLSSIKQGEDPRAPRENDALDVAQQEVDRIFDENAEVSNALNRECVHVIVARWEGRNGYCKYNADPNGRHRFNKRLTGIVDADGHYLVGANEKIFEQGNHDEFIDTIRHEVAHAVCYELYGESQKHNARWKDMAASLGADPSSCHNKRDRSSEYNYFVYCTECGQKYGKVKRSKTIKKPFHRKCGKCGHSPLSSYEAGDEPPTEEGVVAVDSIEWDDRGEWLGFDL